MQPFVKKAPTRCRIAILLSLLVQAFPIAEAHDDEDAHSHAPPAVTAKERYRPTAMPDRVILTISGDPRTTQSVTWRTSPEVKEAFAEIAIAEAGPSFPKKAKKHQAKTQLLKSDLSEAHYHSFTFESLSPGTTYAYRVGDGGKNWSEWCQFKTAVASEEKFSFVYFGDAQNSVRSMWSRVVREAYRDAPRAAFFLHAGDLINRAESDGEWGEWFEAGGWLNRSTPSIAIPGNHEQAGSALGRRLSRHWRPTFTFAENGPKGLEESCYTLVYHNLRIVALNSNVELEKQAEWMDRVLAENEAPWVVCTFHHPVFSTGNDRDNATLRTLWKPVFDKHQVDLVLQGHDHTYGRTGLDVPGVQEFNERMKEEARKRAEAKAKARKKAELEATKKASQEVKSNIESGSECAPTESNVPIGVQKVEPTFGTVYVVSVSGPKMYNNTQHEFMTRVAEDTQLYQIIHINGDKLSFEARTAVGEIYDAFELHKQEGKINKLVDLQPDTPQRLRKSK
ncbi:MAG: metallophosphoesterase family protein [Planctomycetota bacterium]|nr:metallophosphoesterase family protein [Planctomycetota bacterium]